MSCCPFPVIKSCKCAQPPTPPIRHLPYYPTPYTSPCSTQPFNSGAPNFVYGGYLSRPWEGLCGRHPFQGDFKQLIYYQRSEVHWIEWLLLYCMWVIVYLLLPMLLIGANLVLILFDVSKLHVIICALTYNAYSELISAHLRSFYEDYKQRLQQRSLAQFTLMQIIQSYRPCYNQLTFSIQ